LYSGLTWRFSDFTNAGLAFIVSIDDGSFIPMATFSHDLFQGVALSAMAQIPVDRNLLYGGGDYGEFGPTPFGAGAGSHFYLEVKLRLKF
jgi:hypothetical protein